MTKLPDANWHSGVIEVNEDGVITFPDDVLAHLGWKAGDDLDFNPQPDGTILVTKVNPPTITIDAETIDGTGTLDQAAVS